MPLFLNGLSVAFSCDSVAVYCQPCPDPDNVSSLREQLGDDWFSLWSEGVLHCLPRVEQPAKTIGEQKPVTLDTLAGLRVVKALLNDAFPQCFPKYEPIRDRPFSFLAQKEEFVGQVTAEWTGVHPLVSSFEIRPRFELDPRILEIHDGSSQIGVILRVATRWNTVAELPALVEAGVDLGGLHVVYRQAEPGTRRLVGRISRVVDNTVHLSEAYDDKQTVDASLLKLEGSRETFARCLTKLLGKRYRDLTTKLDDETGQLLNGPGLDSLLDRMRDVLVKASPITLCEGLTCTVEDRIQIKNSADYKASIRLKPAQYSFDRARTKLTDYAWPGLERFGPFDRESFPRRTPKILVVAPDTAAGRVGQSIKNFRDGFSSNDGSRFSNGFAGTFRLVNPDFVSLDVKLFGVERESVANTYRASIEDHLARNPDYDAAITVLLDEHAELPDTHNPYLVSKAVLLTNGIPVQEARFPTITGDPQNLQYRFQNIATALYAKMGGIPWTIDHGETADDEIVIGLGTAELSGSRFESRQRHVGITTVFRGDGNYLLSNLSRECSYETYPEVLRESTVEVLKEIKERNAWQPGHTIRVVFHAFKPLKNIEVADIIKSCVDEVGHDQQVEFAFLTVTRDHPFALLDTAETGVKPRYGNGLPKGVYVPDRGTVVQLGKYTRLLCTNGPRLVKRSNSPLPSPLLLNLHKSSTYRDFPYLADQALKFTALSWKSTLPADRPVTILYSSLIAGLLARLDEVKGWSPAVLNTKLRTSKWFL